MSTAQINEMKKKKYSYQHKTLCRITRITECKKSERLNNNNEVLF